MTAPDWRIADAVPADAPAIAALFAASRAAAMPWLPVLHTPDEDRAFFAAVIAAHRVRIVREAALLGFAASRPGWIDHLYIAPGVRRRGIGAALLADALAGAGETYLWAFQQNAAARAFYRRFGFAEVELTDGARNEERTPDVLLRWRSPLQDLVEPTTPLSITATTRP